MKKNIKNYKKSTEIVKKVTINIIGSDNIKRYVFIRQQGYKDCGCACMLMIIKYYNGSVSLEYLREITKTTNNGTSLYNIVHAAKQMGFNSYGLKGSLESLDSSLLPVIAHGVVEDKYKHFIVIYKIDKKRKKVTIADPADKIKEISFDAFKKFSTGYYCILEFLKPLPKLNEVNNFSHFILNSIKKNKKIFFKGFLFSFLFIFFSIFICYYIQFVVDYAIAYQSLYNLICLSILFLSLMLIKNIFAYLKNKICISLNSTLDETLTTTTFQHILSLPYFYYKNHPSGEILARIKDIKELNDVFSKTVLDIVVHSIILIITFFMLFFLDKIFLFILCFLVITSILIFSFFHTIICSLNNTLHKKAGFLNNLLIESLGLIQTIKNLGIDEKFKTRFHLYYKNFLINKNMLLHQHNQSNFIIEILHSIGIIVFVFTACFLIINKKYSIGFLFTYQQIFSYFNDSFLCILNSFLEIKNSKISFDRLKELYNIKEEENKNHVIFNIKGNIKVQDLSFSFGRYKILNHTNLEIKKGQKVMLIGPSGAGKSTLVKMLAKLIEVERNKIFIDGIDLCDFNIDNIRNHICYLAQNEILLTDTIYNNVTLFRNVKYEDFLKVSKVSLLEEMLEKKHLNYDFLLEENGFNLSGGERQRILLARTILKKATIYILDESLSEIDSSKERKILTNLFRLYKDKTIIVISHRLENSNLFDLKIKLENGVCSYE